jgi:hypothetical protein
MPKAVFQYEGALRGASWHEVSTSAQDGAWSMRFKADGLILSVHVEVPTAASIGQGSTVADRAVDDLIKTLAKTKDVALRVTQLERPSCVSSCIIDETPPGSINGSSVARVAVTADLVSPIDDSVVHEICERAASGPVHSTWTKEFTEAMRDRDQLVRFVRIYELLGKIAGSSAQKSIDKLILETDPSVTVSPRPQGLTAGNETIYSRLRNEISHPADRAPDPGELRREVGDQIGKLQELVSALL